METILWMIAGIIMFAITIFVHRHTYCWSHVERKNVLVKLPRWAYWTWLLIALIPIVNVICFSIGAFTYMLSWANDEAYFKCEAKWWTKMVEFLNKGV